METSDKAFFEKWIQLLLDRLDHLERQLCHLGNVRSEKREDSSYSSLEEQLLDNQDLCQLLRISKRTLQRYRSEGLLPYRILQHKTYYRKEDVRVFLQKYMQKVDTDLSDFLDFPKTEQG